MTHLPDRRTVQVAFPFNRKFLPDDEIIKHLNHIQFVSSRRIYWAHATGSTPIEKPESVVRKACNS